MRLGDIYDACVSAGMAADPRGQAEIDRVLADARKEYDKLDEDDEPFFDTEKLTNPYADTRICAGDPDTRGPRPARRHRHGGRRGPARRPAAREGRADRPRLRAPPRGPGLREPARGHVHAGRPVGRSRASRSRPATRSSRRAPRRSAVASRRSTTTAPSMRPSLLGFASLSCHTPADNSVQRVRPAFLDEREPRDARRRGQGAARRSPSTRTRARKGYGPR